MTMNDRREDGQVLGGAGTKVQAYCLALVVELPRGRLGCAIAEELLAALPMAHGRRLPDVVGSAPLIFHSLVEWGILRSLPSARVMSAALECVAAVSPLVERRSPRLWVLRLSHFSDDRSPLAEAVRRRIPNNVIEMAPAPACVTRPAARRSIRDERDLIAVELAAVNREVERLQLALEQMHGAQAKAEQRAARATEATTVMRQQLDAAERREAVASEKLAKMSEQLELARRRVDAAERRAAEMGHQRSDAIGELAAAEDREGALQQQLKEQRASSLQRLSDTMNELDRVAKTAASATKEVHAATTRSVELQRQLDAETTRAAEAKAQSKREIEALGEETIELRRTASGQAERIKTLELVSAMKSQERAKILKALGMSTYDDRVMIDVFYERMSALDAALGELRELRKILRVGPQDPRPLQEILEAELRGRATGRTPNDPQRR